MKQNLCSTMTCGFDHYITTILFSSFCRLSCPFKDINSIILLIFILTLVSLLFCDNVVRVGGNLKIIFICLYSCLGIVLEIIRNPTLPKIAFSVSETFQKHIMKNPQKTRIIPQQIRHIFSSRMWWNLFFSFPNFKTQKKRETLIVFFYSELFLFKWIFCGFPR